MIRRLKAFLECYGDRGRLEPYTYLRALPQLGWSLWLPPSQVELLEAFVRLQDVEEACRGHIADEAVADQQGDADAIGGE